MRRSTRWGILLCAGLAAGLAAGCDDGEEDDEAPVLGASHPGYSNPLCLSCHTPDGHNDGLRPFECAECHGVNGAFDRHVEAEECGACHDPLPHGTEGFPDPESCLTCHLPS